MWPQMGLGDILWRESLSSLRGKGDRFSATIRAKLLKLYTILKKNAFNHRLFMEKIPIKLLSTIPRLLRQAATSTKSQHLRYFSPCQTAVRSSDLVQVKPLQIRISLTYQKVMEQWTRTQM